MPVNPNRSAASRRNKSKTPWSKGAHCTSPNARRSYRALLAGQMNEKGEPRIYGVPRYRMSDQREYTVSQLFLHPQNRAPQLARETIYLRLKKGVTDMDKLFSRTPRAPE